MGQEQGTGRAGCLQPWPGIGSAQAIHWALRLVELAHHIDTLKCGSAEQFERELGS